MLGTATHDHRKLDIAVAGAEDAISLLLGHGDGTFERPTLLQVGLSPVSVAAADVNGDSYPDLLTANLRSNDLSVLLGKGDGTFAPAEFFAVGDTPSALVVAVLDGDGRLDVAVANRESNDVTVMRRRKIQACPSGERRSSVVLVSGIGESG